MKSVDLRAIDCKCCDCLKELGHYGGAYCKKVRALEELLGMEYDPWGGGPVRDLLSRAFMRGYDCGYTYAALENNTVATNRALDALDGD